MERQSVASAVDASLYPVAVLIDELRHDDIQLRLNSIRNLSTIAVALGPQRTRDELIPFLQEIDDDDDEVLKTLAEQLGRGVSWCGGPAYAHTLIGPLEELCNAEEVTVRSKATAAICELTMQMQADQVQRHICALIGRLAAHEWFTSRTSACGLFAAALKIVGEGKQDELLKTFYKLCGDDAPMVRRQAASVLGGVAEVFEGGRATPPELLEVFEKLSKDEQDSVRILAISNCVALGHLKCGSVWKAQILLVIRASAEDKSWRVRYMMADHVQRLCEVFGDEAPTAIVPLHLKLLGDPEAEVRTIAAARLTHCAAFDPSKEFVELLVPALEKITLPREHSPHVRASIAGSILGLAPIFGAKLTVDYLINFVLHLIRDECPDVRLKLIASLGDLANVIGVDVLSQSLLPSIRELGQDRQWRVRLAVVEYTPLLAKQLREDQFTPEIRSLLEHWLSDPVFTVRDAAAKGCWELSRTLGQQWSEANLIPLLKSLAVHKNYLYRISAMIATRMLAEASATWPALEPHLVPLAMSLVNDNVPNVRFNVAKTLQALYRTCKSNATASSESSLASLLIGLRKLAADQDRDVSFFARKAKQDIGVD